MAAGITLKGLQSSRASLEEAYFAITGGAQRSGPRGSHDRFPPTN